MRLEFKTPPPTVAALQACGMASGDVGGLYISARYKGAEFCRVGYYVRYEDPLSPPVENLPDGTPGPLHPLPENPSDWVRLERVLSDARVTRFVVAWDAKAATRDAAEGDATQQDFLEAKRQRIEA